jgi:hypothetical protein
MQRRQAGPLALQPLPAMQRLTMVSKPLAAPPVTRNPVQQRYLIGSKWSRVDGQATFVHYECIARDADQVIFRSVLRPFDTITFPWRELRNVAAWHPGWVNCRDFSAEPEPSTADTSPTIAELQLDVTDIG